MVDAVLYTDEPEGYGACDWCGQSQYLIKWHMPDNDYVHICKVCAWKEIAAERIKDGLICGQDMA